MSKRLRMKNRYRRFSYLSDWGGMKHAIGRKLGFGPPKQPQLNTDYIHQEDDPAFDEKWFIKTIKDTIATHPENSMEYPFYGERIFDEPLVGFVKGNDPIFTEFQKVIGPQHFLPQEIMQWQAEKNGVSSPAAEDLSIVSFVLPLTKKTKQDNAKAEEWLSERWAQTRLLGELFIKTMVAEIVTLLMSKGILALAPDTAPLFKDARYTDIGWASPWSHRHIAYAAGLGTFGIHDFLITEKGSSHRLGSFVVNLNLNPNRKRPEDIHASCLQYQGRECLKCARRCPVNAISAENAHDKELCYQRVVQSTKHCNKQYHIFIYGCGLCATGVPCESRIPKALQKGT